MAPEPEKRSGAGDASHGGSRTTSTARRTDTTDPRRSRARALKVLFQADVRGLTPDEALARLDLDPAARAILDDLDPGEGTGEPLVVPASDLTGEPGSSRQPAPIDGFTRGLVSGVGAHLDAVDELIERHAHRWTVARMPVVDRCVLRLATYELLHESTPPAVAIDQAVTLVKQLSTDDSGRYVNGVLEAIRRSLPPRTSEAPSPPA